MLNEKTKVENEANNGAEMPKAETNLFKRIWNGVKSTPAMVKNHPVGSAIVAFIGGALGVAGKSYLDKKRYTTVYELQEPDDTWINEEVEIPEIEVETEA